MNKILDCHGGSNYKIPHLGKEKLEREGRLPLVLKVTETAWDFLDCSDSSDFYSSSDSDSECDSNDANSIGLYRA